MWLIFISKNTDMKTITTFLPFVLSNKQKGTNLKLLFILFFIVPFFSFVNTTVDVAAPSLGTYPDVTIATAGGNSTVMPDVAPTDATTITGYTDTNFKGKITVSPITGEVNITNAYPAGNYTVTVNAGSGVLKTFSLTVGNPLCSNSPSLPSPVAFSTADGALSKPIILK